MKLGERPVFHSPVDGRVSVIKQEPWGAVRIVDENGYEHVFFHGYVASPGPLDKSYFGLKEGDMVKMGQPLGYIGHNGLANERDHVHYSLRDPEGNFIDPNDTLRDPTSGAMIDIPSNWDRYDSFDSLWPDSSSTPELYDERYEQWNNTA